MPGVNNLKDISLVALTALDLDAKVLIGKSVNFLRDKWVSGINNSKILALLLYQHQILTPRWFSILELMASGTGIFLNGALPADICACITNIHAPPHSLGIDTIAWAPSHDGPFSLKTAYSSLMGLGTVAGHYLFRLIWRWKGVERVKSFLWLVAKKRS